MARRVVVWLLFLVVVATACAPVRKPPPPPTIAIVTQALSPDATLIPPTLATPAPPAPPADAPTEATPITTSPTIAPTPQPTPEPVAATIEPQSIGISAGGRPLLAHRLGAGDAHIAVVGGIHGGYEWNAILLAEQMLDYFRANPTAVPTSLTLHIIPNANPDGLYAVTGREGAFAPADIYADSVPGRFNGNGVDLNRNWDCHWTPAAFWRDTAVPAGDSPFSEPESRALRDYLLPYRPVVVIFLHSAANAVYVSGCPGPHPPSEELAQVYGRAADYPVFPVFDHYLITGDAGDWLTTQGIPSFSVELVTHEEVEFEKNLAGILALLHFIAEQQSIKMREPFRYDFK